MSKFIILYGDNAGKAEDIWGIIPDFLHDDDPRPARDQINERYGHGGGWRPLQGFARNLKDGTLTYPGDEPFPVLSALVFRGELLTIHPAAVVCIVQPGGEFEVCRLD